MTTSADKEDHASQPPNNSSPAVNELKSRPRVPMPPSMAHPFASEPNAPSPADSGTPNGLPIPNTTARSNHSERSRPTNTFRPNCRYASTQLPRRRVPYNIGTDPLEPRHKELNRQLDPTVESELTAQIAGVHTNSKSKGTLGDSDVRSQEIIEKLQTFLEQTWPERCIQVDMFGSSGNLLWTNRSDVDICITMKGEESTCVLAEKLDKFGMKEVTCVHAKAVPIVKIWDSELKLACDLNINNHVALRNTKLVKAYVEIDPDRVKPLAIAIKHWTNARSINQAPGATLSSYTWTLLIINYLQTLDPPVLPTIPIINEDGEEKVNFEDLASSKFISINKSSVGYLLWNFFRYYGHVFDYETSVVSVRMGKLLTKREKEWQFATNNRLCVEEPFNIDRNLANTADETSFRGIHLEIRRAFDLLTTGHELVSSICAIFEFSKEEPKPIIPRAQERSRPIQRPVLTRSASRSSRSSSTKRMSYNGYGRSNLPRDERRQGNQTNRRLTIGSTSYNQYPPLDGNSFVYDPQTGMVFPSSALSIQPGFQSVMGFQQQNMPLPPQYFTQHLYSNQAIAPTIHQNATNSDTDPALYASHPQDEYLAYPSSDIPLTINQEETFPEPELEYVLGEDRRWHDQQTIPMALSTSDPGYVTVRQPPPQYQDEGHCQTSVPGGACDDFQDGPPPRYESPRLPIPFEYVAEEAENPSTAYRVVTGEGGELTEVLPVLPIGRSDEMSSEEEASSLEEECTSFPAATPDEVPLIVDGSFASRQSVPNPKKDSRSPSPRMSAELLARVNRRVHCATRAAAQNIQPLATSGFVPPPNTAGNGATSANLISSPKDDDTTKKPPALQPSADPTTIPCSVRGSDAPCPDSGLQSTMTSSADDNYSKSDLEARGPAKNATPAIRTNEWQQAGGRKGRNSRHGQSLSVGSNVNSRGWEPLPANASERKGG